MGLMDKIKNLMGGEDEYDDIPEEDDELIDRRSSSADDDYYSSYKNRSPRESFTSQRDTSDRQSKVVNIHATTQLQVVLIKPERITDGPSIADHLNEKRTVVLNLEDSDDKLCRRLIDFLQGVAYANRGQIKQVAKKTYIITPFNVGITGDILFDQLENSGIYM